MAIRQTDSDPTAESEAESPDEATGYAGAIREEQEYVTMLYGLLDQARERSERELAGGPGLGRGRRHPPGTSGAGRFRGGAREANSAAQPDRARTLLRPHGRRYAKQSLHR